MLPPQSIDNKKLANLILSRKMATLEQIQALWPYCSPQKDIGALCVEQGILPPVIYQKMVEFLIASPQPGGGMQGAGSHQGPVSPATAQMHPPETVKRTPAAAPPVAPVKRDTQHPKDVLPSYIENPDGLSPSSTTAGKSIDPMQKYTGKNSELPPIGTFSSVADVFRYARMTGASDVHISVNSPLVMRRLGELVPANESALRPEVTKKLIGTIVSDDQRKRIEQKGDLEFVYQLDDAGRFRVTAMKQRAGWDLTARCIPDTIIPFEETGMPDSCRMLTQWAQGLVLVTGPASCGKSSTLTTLVELVNQTRNDHIITLEAPIEYIFTSARAQITQREIGKDTVNQEAALKAALREDPDIIVIGELRDLSTIRLAVSAAETGHLVFASMNTISASRTIYRLIDSFPPEEQGIMRNMISESLRGVISQQLIPCADGCGMVAAFEVLIINSAVANMIRKDETHQLGTAMITGKAAGMQLLDDSLNALAAQGLITEEEVAARSMVKKAMK